VDPISAVLIHKALDGLSMRQAATAQNIANASTAGYRPVRVTFEESLRAAAGQSERAIRNVRPQLVRADSPAFGTEMRLDLELATASETANRYAALVSLLDRQMQIQRTAIRGGQ
jgi:flagellar basal-body rod protein FlgB